MSRTSRQLPSRPMSCHAFSPVFVLLRFDSVIFSVRFGLVFPGLAHRFGSAGFMLRLCTVEFVSLNLFDQGLSLH